MQCPNAAFRFHDRRPSRSPRQSKPAVVDPGPPRVRRLMICATSSASVRGMAALRTASAYAGTWLAATLLLTLGLYALGYLLSPNGPSCVTGRPGAPSTEVPLAVVT